MYLFFPLTVSDFFFSSLRPLSPLKKHSLPLRKHQVQPFSLFSPTVLLQLHVNIGDISYILSFCLIFTLTSNMKNGRSVTFTRRMWGLASLDVSGPGLELLKQSPTQRLTAGKKRWLGSNLSHLMLQCSLFLYRYDYHWVIGLDPHSSCADVITA